MKSAYTVLLILVTLLLVSGCSEDKPANHETGNVSGNIVRKAVKKPFKKTEPREETRKETTEMVENAPGQETSRKSGREIDQKKPQKEPIPVQAEEKEETSLAQKTEKEEDVPEEKANIYITKEGDTLTGISGKPYVYNNPLKWPLLYMDNPEALSEIKDKDDLYETGLPAGIKLNIISSEEVEKNLAERSGDNYVVNLISSQNMEEIAPRVVKLIDAGYFVYISSALVNGKEWYRVRAGFFKSRSEANSEGDKIRKNLNISDIWTVKIGDTEFHDFGGY